MIYLKSVLWSSSTITRRLLLCIVEAKEKKILVPDVVLKQKSGRASRLEPGFHKQVAGQRARPPPVEFTPYFQLKIPLVISTGGIDVGSGPARRGDVREWRGKSRNDADVKSTVWPAECSVKSVLVQLHT